MTPTVSRQEIDDLKARVHLAELLQHHGVEIRKIGRGVKALCPFHDEKTPLLSIDAKKGLYHCFGCGKSGDHFSFLQEHARLSFAEAVAELSRFARVASDLTPTEPDPDAKKPFPYELMELVVEIWHQAFCEQPEALAYLEGRGIYDKGLLRDLRVGYCDGEKLLAISNAQERQLLQRVGILNEGGKELFARCVVFALRDRHNRVTGFYGRSVSHNAKVQHRCAGSGSFCPQALQGASSVILAEGVLDALAIIQAGFSNVVALGGAQGFSASLLEQLHQASVQEVVLCLDGDEAGEQATQALKERLLAEKFAVRCISLPTGLDPLSVKTELLRELLAGPMDNAKRSYRKLSAAQGKLKVLICVENEGQREEATVDLYSARSRRQEALTIGRRLGLEPQDLEKWFFRVLTELEEAKGQDAQLKEMFAPVHIPPMSHQQREEALAFLTDPNLVNRILADMESLGYTGEEETKLLGYCVSVSRLLDKPLSAIIQSGSGAGKSFLAETVQELTPPEGVVFYSRLSP
ncbi:toprim domain-containing protein [bacterium]|nr:toprim domain-containing protein [bacterium]